MSVPANIRVNIGAPFPALVKGAGVVALTKRNGMWTVSLNYAVLGITPVIADPPNTYTLVWNALTGVFAVVPVSLLGSGGITPKIVTFAMSPYTPLLADRLLLVDTTGGVVVINMMLAAARLTGAGYLDLTIKDDKGNSAVNAIMVNRAGGDLLDNLAAYPIDTAYAAVTFQAKAGGYAVV